MSILEIKARIVCDGCGNHFLIEVDPARKTEGEQTIWDLVQAEIADGPGVEVIGHCEPGMSSYQGDRQLCPGCTKKADAFLPESEDRDLTADEVTTALGADDECDDAGLELVIGEDAVLGCTCEFCGRFDCECDDEPSPLEIEDEPGEEPAR